MAEVNITVTETEKTTTIIDEGDPVNLLDYPPSVVEIIVTDPREIRVVSIIEQGLPGRDGILSISEDPNPTLGGDLILGNYNILGQLENQDFILDGGLLG